MEEENFRVAVIAGLLVLVCVLLAILLAGDKKDEYKLNWKCGELSGTLVIVGDVNINCNLETND